MPDDSPVVFERHGVIACLRFNRPGVLVALDAMTARAFEPACLRRLLRRSFGRNFEARLAVETGSFAACASTRDFGEGVLAFVANLPQRLIGA